MSSKARKKISLAIFGSKEWNFCHKLRFSNSYNLAIRFPRPLIFQHIKSGRSNSLNLNYQKFAPFGCKDIGVGKCKFVAKTQFLCHICCMLKLNFFVGK